MSATTQPRFKFRLGLVSLAFIAFISLGMPDGLFGVAWPSIRHTFDIPHSMMGLFLLTGTSGYMLSSFFSSKMIERLGVGGLLALSCLLTASCLLGLTIAPSFAVMVGLNLLGGLGGGAIDGGINTYIASEHSDKLMQWLHAFFGIGITAGPAIMTIGLSLTGDWRNGYRVVGLAQLLLAVVFALTARKWTRTKSEEQAQARILDYHTPLRQTLAQPWVWVSLLLFFIYTGLETTLGNWAYTLLTESRGVKLELAGFIAGSYWASFTLGRFLAGVVTSRVGLDRLISASVILAIIGSAMLWLVRTPAVSALGMGIIGLAIAPVFPALVSGTARRVGVLHAANTIGMQITAAGFSAFSISGGAGLLAQRFSLEAIPPYLTALYTLLLVLHLLSISRKPEAGTHPSHDPESV